MSQKNSGYERIARDAYMTPYWVTDAALSEIAGGTRLPRGSTVWEPAAGTGQMVERLEAAGLNVIASDIDAASHNQLEADFLSCMAASDTPSASRPDAACQPLLPFAFDAINTNPPFKLAEKFVRRALDETRAKGGLVAMLLPVDFDSAKTRADIFANHPAWGLKIVLLDRITWFEPKSGDQSPSANHAWFVWDWRGSFGRTIRYAQAPSEVLAEISRKRSVPRRQTSRITPTKQEVTKNETQPIQR